MTVPRLVPAHFAQLVAARVEHDTAPATSLCHASVEVLGVAGAGLVLMSGGRSLDFIGVSDAAADAVEQMEYTLGEGPCVSAYHTKAPVFDADLADGADDRWPEFRRVAIAAGFHSAFGFPLLIERVCIGALNLYHDRPGALTDGQVADALVIATFASQAVMAWQANAPPGALAWQLEHAPNNRVQVHQATGRISVQVGISLDDALVLLRAYSFSHDRPIGDVAADIATGLLSLA
jgi:GAF domain